MDVLRRRWDKANEQALAIARGLSVAVPLGIGILAVVMLIHV